MSSFCSKCGSEIKDGGSFCPNCGSPAKESEKEEVKVESTDANNSTPANMTIEKREIALAIILSIITCGIYGIIWFIGMTDDVNKLTGDNKTSGGMAFLFSLLTCGIYGIYWSYRMGQRLNEAGKMYDKNIEDNSILYLVLTIFGLQIVSWALIQNEINGFATK